MSTSLHDLLGMLRKARKHGGSEMALISRIQNECHRIAVRDQKIQLERFVRRHAKMTYTECPRLIYISAKDLREETGWDSIGWLADDAICTIHCEGRYVLALDGGLSVELGTLDRATYQAILGQAMAGVYDSER